MIPQQIQKKDMAGYTKLTMVSIYANGVRQTKFIRLKHDENGHARLPMDTLNRILDSQHVRRGDTYSVGI